MTKLVFDAAEGGPPPGVSTHKSHAPARHVVALREREKLDRDVLRTGNLQHARRTIAVEDDIRVGKIVDDEDPQVPAERDDPLEERKFHALSRWVRRKVQDQQL